jgi:putative sugar O-methyltransferase
MINKVVNLIKRTKIYLFFEKLRVKKTTEYLKKKKFYEKDNFNELSKKFLEKYSLLDKNTENFVLPVWKGFQKKTEEEIIKKLSMRFLRIPEIRGTMVITAEGKIMRKELKFLREKVEENKLKMLLEEEYVGDPFIVNNKYKTSHNAIHTLYHLTKFIEETKFNPKNIKSVVEWGGGYGHLANIFQRIKKEDLTYTIIDLPLFSCIQWIYLSSIFGENKINLINKKNNKIIKNKINLLPVSHLKDVDVKGDMFISTWALSESSDYSQKYVLNKNWFSAKYILLAYQKSNVSTPYAENIGKIAKEAGAKIKETEILKKNYYAYLIKNE